MAFPPSQTTLLTNVIPSYLYQQYNDDDDMISFVQAYNQLAQQYVDWFSNLNLPVYTAPTIIGELLDWIALGLYGMSRPVLPSGYDLWQGSFNTYVFNPRHIPFNGLYKVSSQQIYFVSDDMFKRILTWHFYKGDGKVFNIRWLKRRIARFLNGTNGSAPNIDNTYTIDVTFTGLQVNINMGGTTNPAAQVLKTGIEAGVIEMPFQFTYAITI